MKYCRRRDCKGVLISVRDVFQGKKKKGRRRRRKDAKQETVPQLETLILFLFESLKKKKNYLRTHTSLVKVDGHFVFCVNLSLANTSLGGDEKW